MYIRVKHMIDKSTIKEDIMFLISFAPATSEDEVVEGLFPTAYITNTYEGDVKIAKRVREICERYGINTDPKE